LTGRTRHFEVSQYPSTLERLAQPEVKLRGIEEVTNRGLVVTRWRLRAPAVRADPLTLSLTLIFAAGAGFYLWTAATTYAISFTGGQADFYNELANSLLHLHLWIAHAPPGLVHLSEPYNPVQNAPYQATTHDLSLYHGRFYLDWGPAPVVVLLVPMNLLGLAPTSSLTCALFAIAGLGFALATVRIIWRRFDGLPLWMGVLAGAVIVLCTGVPFVLRRPAIYEEAITAGYCFVMAGVLLAMRSIVRRRASLLELALMSLCFGLAAGSRPPLAAAWVLAVPVYLAVRPARRKGWLVAALFVPCAVCLLLLLAYNYARFGNPLEVGQSYQLSSFDPRHLRFGSLSYIPPNLWYYGLAPPRPTILFPFLALTPLPETYPLGNPAHYIQPEITGGVLVMSPLMLFAFALPWLRWRRPRAVAPLGTPLLLGAGAGLCSLLFVSFEFFNSTERYEVDFAALLLFAALAAWFALSLGEPSRRRRVVRFAGAVLAVWGCLTGLAISFNGYLDLLRQEHPGTYRTLEDVTSPISTVAAMIAGRPVLGHVQAPSPAQLQQVSRVHLTSLGAGVESVWLASGTSATLTVVSPDRRLASLTATAAPGAELGKGGRLWMRIADDPSKATYQVPVTGGPVRVPLLLDRGLNRLTLSPAASALNTPNPTVPGAFQLLIVKSMSLAAHD
jgi:hypothetical protein